MAEAIAIINLAGSLIKTVISISVLRPFRLWDLYGAPGIFLLLFGSRTTWSVEAQVLGRLDEDDALQFKKSVQDECTMVSVAAAIVAQIAITALSLDGLSQTHWVAKGFLVFSLISALMAVYYATTQQRAMGRLLRPNQIRAWIRGGTRAKLPPIIHLTRRWLKKRDSLWAGFRSYDLEDIPQDQYIFLIFPNHLRRTSFTPSVVSVMTISAPQMLLSGSLIALLLGLGIYFGFVWTAKLDTQAGLHDSRNIFIMFAVSLGVCTLVYSLSSLIHEKEERPEANILESYMKDYIRPRKEELEARWGVQIWHLDDMDSVHITRNTDGQYEPSSSSSSSPYSTAPSQPQARPQSFPETKHDIFKANAPSHAMTV